MKTKDLATVTAWAVGTAALTVVTFWTGPLTAGNEGDGLEPLIAAPKLTCHGIVMTLAPADGRVFKAGDEPVFALQAVNTTDQPATATVHVVMSSMLLADAMSRVPQMPSVRWQQQQSLALSAHETKKLTLETQTKLPAGAMIAVMLQEAAAGSGGLAPSSLIAPVAKGPAAPASIVALQLFTEVEKAPTVSIR